MPARTWKHKVLALLFGIGALCAVTWLLRAVAIEGRLASATPKVIVLDDSDDDYKTPPFEDAATIFNANGQVLRKTAGLNLCQTIGGSRALATTKDESLFVVCETVGDKLIAFRTETAERLWSLDGKFSSATVAPDGQIYALLGATTDGSETVVIDSQGHIMRRANIGGFDIALDAERKVLWIAGGKISKCDLDLQLLAELDPIPWCAVSVDVAPDGSAWVAEREHFQVAQSTNRLLKISPAGQILQSVYLQWSPTCVRVNRSDGTVWATGSEGRKPLLGRVLESVEKRTGALPVGKTVRDFLTRPRVITGTHQYDSHGTLLRRIGLGGHSMDVNQADGSVWIATDRAVYHYSAAGLRFGRIAGLSSSQKKVVVLPGPRSSIPIAIARGQIWNVVFLAGFVVYLGIRGVFAQRTKTNQKVLRRVDSLEKALLGFVIPTSALLPVLYLFTPWLVFADYPLPEFAPWCGAVLMVAALWLFWRSHADLGLNWSVSLELRKEHQLVRHGVYRAIRHPMYASILLWGIAQGFLLENWLAGWSALVPFALMYLLRTPREEQMMIEFFGDEYRDYMRQTGRLIPRRISRRS